MRIFRVIDAATNHSSCSNQEALTISLCLFKYSDIQCHQPSTISHLKAMLFIFVYGGHACDTSKEK